MRQNRMSTHIGKFYNFHCERILTTAKLKHSCEIRDVEGAVPYGDTQSPFRFNHHPYGDTQSFFRFNHHPYDDTQSSFRFNHHHYGDTQSSFRFNHHHYGDTQSSFCFNHPTAILDLFENYV